MNRRNSKNKLNGDILLLQNNLMSKLSTVTDEQKGKDELGFTYAPSMNHEDALTNLINRSKNITKNHAKEIDSVKMKQRASQQFIKKRQSEGTFLTGLGMPSENSKKNIKVQEQPSQTKTEKQIEFENDPNEMLKDILLKEKKDDLSELRKMIRNTGEKLQFCSKKLNKSKKNLLGLADKYTNQMPKCLMKTLNNYCQFEVNRL